MADSQKLKIEVDSLLEGTQRLVQQAGVAGASLGADRIVELSSIAVRTGQLVRRLYGPGSQYDQSLQKVLNTEVFTMMHSNHYEHVAELAGILQGVQHDLSEGMLFDLRLLLQAEVFADFLEMAEHLLSKGYKDAAAVLLGAVLEDSLRKLAESQRVPTTGENEKPLTMDPLNVALAKAGAYGPLVQKQITTWANLRNDAAHGNFSKYDAEHVGQMLLFVQKFCAEYLT